MGMWDDARRKVKEEEEQLLNEFQDLFWDDQDLKATIGKMHQHPETPYLKRLILELKHLAAELPFGYKVTRKLMPSLKKERDNLVLRINNILTGNIQSEIIFLEGEIDKLTSPATFNKDVKSNSIKFEGSHPLINLANVFTEKLSQGSAVDVRKRIANYQRDITELKSYKALPAANPEKEKVLEEIKKVENIIAANEEAINEIEQLNIPEPDKRREQNQYQNEITSYRLQLVKLKNQLARIT